MNRLLLFVIAFSILACSDNNNQQPDTNKHIAYYPKHHISITEDIAINLKEPLAKFSSAQELSSEAISSKPSIKGKLFVVNGRRLVFKPNEHLKPSSAYTITLHLDQLIDDLPKDEAKFSFQLETISPEISVNIKSLQSYSEDWQYLVGTLDASDVFNFDEIQSVVKAKQGDQSLKVKFNSSTDASYFDFVIDSVLREEQDSKVHITWDAKSINSKTKGETHFTIPGKQDFSLIDSRVVQSNPSFLILNFSEALEVNQEFLGLIQLGEETDFKFEVDGNLLKIFPSKVFSKEKKLKVFEGITASNGQVLKTNYEEDVKFNVLEPNLRLISNGVILPKSTKNSFYFETVNLAAVDVRVIQIYEDNVLQFLQNEELSNTNSYYLKNVGKLIAKKTIPLNVQKNNEGNWQTHELDLSTIFEASQGSIYQLEFGFRKAYSLYQCEDSAPPSIAEIQAIAQEFENESETDYWNNEAWSFRNTYYNWRERDNPCDVSYFNERRFYKTNLLSSNLGVVVKKTETNSYFIATTNLVSGQPEANVSVYLYDFQQQLINQVKTGSSGFVNLPMDEQVAFVVAQKEDDFAYLKLKNSNALNLSDFQVEGQKLQQGINGFTYTDRGVYRPGETVHLNFVLNDNANPLPDNHPIHIELYTPNGNLYHKETTKKAKHGFHHFSLSTSADDPTGNWRALINVGSLQFTKYISIATVKPNRLRISLSTQELPLLLQDKIQFDLNTEWLTGAKAKNLNAEVNAKFSSVNHHFKGYEKFVFIDLSRNFYPFEKQMFQGKVDVSGFAKIEDKLSFSRKPPGIIRADFLAKVFEGGGDFSIHVDKQLISPFSHLVGLKSKKTVAHNQFPTDEYTQFDVVSLTHEGKPAQQRELKVYIHRVSWQWWWNKGSDGLSRYEDATVHRPYKTIDLTTDKQGNASFKFLVPEEDRGRFLIRAEDLESGHATGDTYYFFKNWWSMQGVSKEQQLVFSSDKDVYQVGEKAIINFPSTHQAKALISVENGSDIIQQEWIDAEKGMTSYPLAITGKMAPNVYVSITLLQAHQNTSNDLPIRLFGVTPIKVVNPERKLSPLLKSPKQIRPEQNYSLEVSENNGREMTYTIAVVDEGLLDLTNFSTPDIYTYFNAKQSLGVRTFDVYEDVIGAFGGKVQGRYKIGGGDEALGKKNRKAERFKPIVDFIGPFQLKKGEVQKHELKMGNYVGSVKAMLVAGNIKNEAFGSEEKRIEVKQPLMILTSVPRRLTPKETLRVPVTLFVMSNELKEVKVEVSSHSKLKLKGESTQTIQVEEPGEYMLYFDFEVPDLLGIASLQLKATSGKEKATNEVEVDILNPNPVSTKIQQSSLQKNDATFFEVKAFGTHGTNEASLSLSTFPSIHLEKRMHYLTSYPHGCVEQITSKAFPQLFLRQLVEMDKPQADQLERQVKKVISDLSRYQLSNGGMAYWQGGNADEWATNYVGHFMLEAKSKAYQLPFGFESKWKKFQQQKARTWTANASSDLTQAYRLYTLALSGSPDIASMNRLKSMSKLSSEAKARLALAYAIVGLKEVAQKLANQLDHSFNKEDISTFGSKLRNQAMLLETYSYLDATASDKVAKEVATSLSSDDWLHTHETAYALLAMAKYIELKGGKEINASFTYQGKKIDVDSKTGFFQRQLPLIEDEISTLEITNYAETSLFVDVLQKGQLPVGEEMATSNNIDLKVDYVDLNGSPIVVDELSQGTEITVKMKVTNNSNTYLKEVALSQFIPSGWELIDTRFTDFESGKFEKANFVDVRDDRVYIYFDLPARKSAYFEVKVNASYLGKYYLPGTQVEAMYNGQHFARQKGQWVEVKK